MKKFTQYVVIIVCILTGTGVTMAEQNLSTEEASLILEPQPLAESEVLKTIDIVSTQKTLGEEGEFRVVDGRVSLGTPFVYKLKSPNDIVEQRGKKSYFYLVEFRFTLYPPENKRRYQEMTLKVKLANPKAVAFQLLPALVETEQDVEQDIDIGFSIALPESQKTSVGANVKKQVTFKRQLPIIKSFGNGESNFYWVYSKPHGAETVESGSRIVAAVIQVPDEARSLSATIQWEVKLNRSFLGDWKDVPVSVEPVTVNLSLDRLKSYR